MAPKSYGWRDCVVLVTSLLLLCAVASLRVRADPHLSTLGDRAPHPIQEEMLPFVDDLLEHALSGYLAHAFHHDSLRPLTGSFRDDRGGLSATLIDSLDTLALTGRVMLFRKYARWVEENVNFDKNVTISAFETNIRIVGGLLAAHFMYEEGIVPVVRAEHDYAGRLLTLAVDLADRILPVFDTPSGIPYGSINLRTGVSKDETEETANAGAGTFLMEWIALSRVTGNPKYEEAARRSIFSLFELRNHDTSLMGSHINIVTGQWVLEDATVGSAVDSTIEYAFKAHMMTGDPELWRMYEALRIAKASQLRSADGMYKSRNMYQPYMGVDTCDSLVSFYAGLLELSGHHAEAQSLVWQTHPTFKFFGAMPEHYNYPELTSVTSRSHYPLRPEHIESIYYLYRSTRDPAYLSMGREVALALHLRTRSMFGFTTLARVSFPHGRDNMVDEMESFMISETLKYLYLLFDEYNVLHGATTTTTAGGDGSASTGAGGGRIGWIFTTEAHVFPNTAEWWRERRRSSSQAARHTRRIWNSFEAALQNRVLAPEETLHESRVRHLEELLYQGRPRAAAELPAERYDAREAGKHILYSYYCEPLVARGTDRLSTLLVY